VTIQSGATAAHGEFTFHFKEVDMPVSLTIESAEPHRIVGLWFGASAPRLKTWDELVKRLAKLPGTVSFRAVEIGKDKPVAELQPEKALAIGSAFKLYILATLVDKKAKWDEVVRLEDRYKSLPSGVLLDWPDGSPLTVHTLATEMISISDNTAADQLLFYAGRDEVQRRLAMFGMKDPAANDPFLSTRELFRLKSNAALRKEYLAADTAGRKKLLAKIDEMPRLKLSDLEWNGPIEIDRLEWIASAADLCRLLGWLDAHGGDTALSIMAVNSGKAMPTARFSYVGYKGGSEAGVLSMSWLLHTKDGRHFAMSAIWNNPREAVDLEKFVGLMSAAGDLVSGR
jgi:beta-lactamase class A